MQKINNRIHILPKKKISLSDLLFNFPFVENRILLFAGINRKYTFSTTAKNNGKIQSFDIKDFTIL